MGAFAFSTGGGGGGGGGGSPGGSSPQIQFNNAGSFGGVTGLEYDSGNTALVAGTDLAGGFRLFNTLDRTTNFEMGRLWWDANILKLETTSGGTGTARAIRFTNAEGVAFGLNAIGSGAGNLELVAQSTAVTNAVGVRTSFTSTASSGTPFHFEIAPTINQSGTAGYTALRVNATETATGSGVRSLLQLAVGGTSRFRVDSIGNTSLSSTATNGIRVFNTADETTNSEFTSMYWASNVVRIGSDVLGTGTRREVQIGNFSAGVGQTYLRLLASGSPILHFLVPNSGTAGQVAFYFNNTGAYTASSSTQTLAQFAFTVNQTATAGYNALDIAVTETGTGSGTKNLLVGRVGGVNRFRVDNIGNTILSSTATSGIQIYRTTDETTNFERISLNFSGTSATLATEFGGTGTGRVLNIQAADGIQLRTNGANTRWVIPNTGHLTAFTDNAFDIGASGASRPRNIFIAGGLTHGSTTLLTTTVALTNGAGAAAGTLTNAPAAGNPTKWIPINDNGTTRHIPAW